MKDLTSHFGFRMTPFTREISVEEHYLVLGPSGVLTLRAGFSVVFFNGYLLHRSRRNNSDIYRRVLVSHYMNAWSLLPWHVEEDNYPAAFDTRTITPVAGVDPYAWKGIAPPRDKVWLREHHPDAAVEQREAKSE